MVTDGCQKIIPIGEHWETFSLLFDQQSFSLKWCQSLLELLDAFLGHIRVIATAAVATLIFAV